MNIMETTELFKPNARAAFYLQDTPKSLEANAECSRRILADLINTGSR